MAPCLESKFALIVDEDAESSEVLFELLEGQGFWPVSAAHEDEAFEYLHQERPALVAVDLADPRGAGRRVFEALSTTPAWAHIPVIALAGSAEECRRRGAMAHFGKPLDRVPLLRELKRVFRGEALPRQVH